MVAFFCYRVLQELPFQFPDSCHVAILRPNRHIRWYLGITRYVAGSSPIIYLFEVRTCSFYIYIENCIYFIISLLTLRVKIKGGS